jgi:hypothetical protein
MGAPAGDWQLAARDEGADAGGGAEAQELGDGFGGEQGGGIGVVHAARPPGRRIGRVRGWGNLLISARRLLLALVFVGPIWRRCEHAVLLVDVLEEEPHRVPLLEPLGLVQREGRRHREGPRRVRLGPIVERVQEKFGAV